MFLGFRITVFYLIVPFKKVGLFGYKYVLEVWGLGSGSMVWF